MYRGEQSDRLVVGLDRGGSDVTVTLVGELDIATAPLLERAVAELSDAASVVLDMRGVTFSDAAGLRAIGQCGRILGSRLIVCGSQPPVRKIIHVTHLDDHVHVEDDVPPEAADTPESDTPGSNVAYVHKLWEAFMRGGAEQFANLVPSDVRWKSLWSDGQVLRGTKELLEFWNSRGSLRITLDTLTAVGDDVLVTWRLDEEQPKQIWSLYRFEGRRLVEAVSFDREADAIAALQLSRRR